MRVVRVLDQAGSHRARTLKIPENITRLPLLPDNPQLNPVKRLWACLKSR